MGTQTDSIQSNGIYDNYIREAKIIHVVDGDTFTAIVELGYCSKIEVDFRLSGLNTERLETDKGKEAKALFNAFVSNGTKTFIHSEMLIKTPNKMKREKWRRFLATVYFLDIENIPIGSIRWVNFNERLLNLGLAVPYDGSGIRD